jgi:hypothetical protein
MKSEEVEINGVKYTVKEIPASIGLPILFTKDNEMDNISFTAACVEVDGKPISPTQLNTGTMMKLIPIAMRINGVVSEKSEGTDGGN